MAVVVAVAVAVSASVSVVCRYGRISSTNATRCILIRRCAGVDVTDVAVLVAVAVGPLVVSSRTLCSRCESSLSSSRGLLMADVTALVMPDVDVHAAVARVLTMMAGSASVSLLTGPTCAQRRIHRSAA